MGLHYENLDETTRSYMVEEIELDIDNGKLYFSTRLNVRGRQEYPDFLRDAVSHYDDDWLARQLSRRNCFGTHETRTRSGKQYMARVPVNAPTMLSEGEFNRFYLRGLCCRAKAENIKYLEIYRGKEVKIPRPESTRMIGKLLEVETLLEDLRTHTGVDTALKLPPGPNSGLTAKLT